MPNFNTFMHRRNIFRKEPDFKKLACDYQELRQYVTIGSKNKPKFDFKNPEALRALTCALLHRYFQKRISIPSDRLIPAVPQRLNYICWIEDLVKLVEQISPDVNVLGLDIGTGASCIFPILSCHRNPTWTFVGVETDEKSHSAAVDNVQKNFLDDKIRLIRINTDDTLADILSLLDRPATFIMCNPPFFEEEYGVTMELNSSSGRPKSSSNTSNQVESICSGGEITFVGRMLEQSKLLKEEVVIYTSMLGRKQSLTHFKQTLSSLHENNLSWTWAELCQGKTIRYAIAWTFCPGLDLTKAPLLRHGKNKSWKFKLTRRMSRHDGQLEMLETIRFLKNLISQDLMIAKTRMSRQTSQAFEMIIKTNERTWTNQRRKRREQFNKHKHQATASSVHIDTTKLTSNLSPNSPPQVAQAQQMICDPEGTSTRKKSNENSNVSQMNVDVDMLSTDPRDIATNIVNHLNSTSMGNANIRHDELPDGSPNFSGQMCSTNLSNKRKNPSSCSSSPSRICPSPNDDLTDDDNQSTDSTDNCDELNDGSSTGINDIKRICISDDSENMDDVYDYLLCCRISLSRVCHDLYFELKLEHPCTAANDAYDLFQYFRNKLTEK